MKTITIDLYEYDELSEESKASAREWYANHRSGYDAYDQAEEDLISLDKTIATVGLKLSNYSIGNAPGDHISIALGGELTELANWTYFYGDEEPFSAEKCPRMKSDGYWLGEGVAEYWNKNCAPEIDKILANANGLCGDALIDADIESVILNHIGKIEDFALRDIQEDREYCYSDDHIADMLENNSYHFTEDGYPA